MRPIAPLVLPSVKPADLTGLAQPDFDLVDPRTLMVDDSYQRNLTPRSEVLIRRIVETFRWSKFKPPICVRVDGELHVVDGQHTAIAVATHPDISIIPVVVVDEPEAVERARAFVSHAQDHLAATPGQVWRAQVAAGDDEATAIERVCRVAGIRLLPCPASRSEYKPRETIALASIKTLIRRRGEEQAALVLAALADSDMAPVTGEAIKAGEALLCEPDYAVEFDTERLSAAFRFLGPRAQTEARELAVAKGLPLWRALVAIVFKHRRTRGPTPVTSATPLPLRRVIDRRPEGGSVPMGEPPPGRSALDQRRAQA